eukprot:TRINITY_DN75703_c0_g1_i1.p1 TRINITY_DN75703_c0_g1~~TRINITY_DN75703_c0_g1_i1.p1  ORF type:complete len:284 (-),score=32.42 TRINITY_DN75703_c0_g1_i1:171-1022(-)
MARKSRSRSRDRRGRSRSRSRSRDRRRSSRSRSRERCHRSRSTPRRERRQRSRSRRGSSRDRKASDSDTAKKRGFSDTPPPGFVDAPALSDPLVSGFCVGQPQGPGFSAVSPASGFGAPGAQSPTQSTSQWQQQAIVPVGLQASQLGSSGGSLGAVGSLGSVSPGCSGVPCGGLVGCMPCGGPHSGGGMIIPKLPGIPGLPGMPGGFMRAVRPETVAAAAAGDPIAIFVAQHGADYSAERALRALPVDLQCRVLNEGPLRATNPSAVLMSRVRRVQSAAAAGS